MEREDYFQNEKNNEGINNNFRNALLIILIVIFAILIERSFPNSILKNIYFILTIVIIISFIVSNLSQHNLNKMKSLFKSLKELFPFLSSNDKDIQKFNKKKLDKIKSVYETGYMNNKRTPYSYSYNEQNQYQNLYQYNSYYPQNKNFYKKNDEDLANKISKINKINKTISMDYTNTPTMYTNTNYGSINNNYENNNNYINNNYINNNYITNNDTNYKLTNLPNSNSNDNEINNKGDYFGNKSVIANPFNDKVNQNSKDSSGNFYLFSMNKKKKESIINNLYNKNSININKFNAQDNYTSSNSVFDSSYNIIPKNKAVSYNFYQSLKNRYSNTQALNPNINNSIDYKKNIDKMPKEIMNVNNSWILKMKIFVSKTLIPNLITKHDNNISNLNAILSSLGLKIINTSPDISNNNYLDILNEKLSLLNSSQIKEYKESSNILYQNLRSRFNSSISNNFNSNNNESKSIFPSMCNFSDYFGDSKELSESKNDNQMKQVFFGDTYKMKQILKLIENKINEIELKKDNETKSNLYYQRQMIVKAINSNDNPFLKKEDNKILDDYIKKINDSNNSTLSNLQNLLYERIIINERLYPKELFYKKNELHALLVIEYAIERFKQLNENFENYGNGSRGGDFLNENWCSLLPTDSQLISHLVINYIESIYLINNSLNQQNFLLSFPSNYITSINEKNLNEKNQTNIFLYQISPQDTEPMFNVAYNNILIPCIPGNMNLFHALSVYFYLLSLKSPMFVMSLGIHNFIDSITK